MAVNAINVDQTGLLMWKIDELTQKDGKPDSQDPRRLKKKDGISR